MAKNTKIETSILMLLTYFQLMKLTKPDYIEAKVKILNVIRKILYLRCGRRGLLVKFTESKRYTKTVPIN